MRCICDGKSVRAAPNSRSERSREDGEGKQVRGAPECWVCNHVQFLRLLSNTDQWDHHSRGRGKCQMGEIEKMPYLWEGNQRGNQQSPQGPWLAGNPLEICDRHHGRSSQSSREGVRSGRLVQEYLLAGEERSRGREKKFHVEVHGKLCGSWNNLDPHCRRRGYTRSPENSGPAATSPLPSAVLAQRTSIQTPRKRICFSNCPVPVVGRSRIPVVFPPASPLEPSARSHSDASAATRRLASRRPVLGRPAAPRRPIPP